MAINLMFSRYIETINIIPGTTIWSHILNYISIYWINISRGIYSDVIVCVIIASILVYLPKIARVAFYIIWILFIAGNYIHIVYNSANIDLFFSGFVIRPEFFFGSVMVSLFRHISLFLSIPIILVLFKVLPARLLKWFSAAMITVSVLFISSPDPEFYSWVQSNVIEENSRNLYAKILTINQAKASPRPDIAKKYFVSDLSAEQDTLIRTKENRKVNILLIFIESLSTHDLSESTTPNLNKLKEYSLFYDSFVATQLQTNNGLYSGICGDYPNFGNKTSKADSIVSTPQFKKHPCLPEILSGLGYHTVFMQSAGLGFMNKDKFSESAGFKEIHGNEYYQNPYRRNGWGVDDRTLLESVHDKIVELRKEKENKWFITALTSGTHPPFNIPDEYAAGDEQLNKRQKAIHYMDNELGKFLKKLKDEKILDDTLVIITADESRSWSIDKSILYNYLVLQWIPLFVLSPENATGINNNLFMLPDLQLSIMDYLGEKGVSIGRSIFRKYKKPRSILFGNVIDNAVYAYYDEEALFRCNATMFQCSQYKVEGGLFSKNYSITHPSENQRNILEPIIRENDF